MVGTGGDTGGERDRVRRPSAVVSEGVAATSWVRSGKRLTTGRPSEGDSDGDWDGEQKPGSRNRRAEPRVGREGWS